MGKKGHPQIPDFSRKRPSKAVPDPNDVMGKTGPKRPAPSTKPAIMPSRAGRRGNRGT